MTDLDKLIEAVEIGVFLAGMVPNETDAYRAFSGSLDAAQKFHDDLLPEYGLVLNLRKKWASTSAEDEYGVTRCETLQGSCSSSTARAALICTLKAYRSQNEN